jgi:hypothetical protein
MLPTDSLGLAEVLRKFYVANSQPVGKTRTRRKPSARKVCVEAGFTDVKWLEKAMRGIRAYQRPPAARLKTLCDAWNLSAAERYELAVAAGLDAESLSPAVKIGLAREQLLTLQRGFILVKAPHRTADTAAAVESADAASRIGVVAERQGAAVRLARVFGEHDMALRVSVQKGTVVEFCDQLHTDSRLQYLIHSTETLIIRDDLQYRIAADSTSELAGRSYLAYVFLEASDPFPSSSIVEGAHQIAQHQGLGLLTAAVVIGRFDVCCEVRVNDINELQKFTGALSEWVEEHQNISPPRTVTYLAFKSATYSGRQAKW